MTAEGPAPELNPLVEKLSDMAQNAASVVLGLGILGINRVQALRRDLAAKRADDESR